MGWLKSESGFTFFEMLLVLTILMITFPFIIFLLQQMQQFDDQENISVQHFFTFLHRDALRAQEVYNENNRLFFVINEHETASVERYNHVIRRRVNDKGHEIYVRDIESLLIQPLEYGFHIKITTLEGESYEKTIVTNQ